MISLTYLDGPLGRMVAGATDKGICLYDFQYRKSADRIMKRIELTLGMPFKETYHPLFDVLQQQMEEYFSGKRMEFDLPLVLAGTSFQVQVWNALRRISYGETVTYKQLAARIGVLQSERAVGSANGANGLAILVPCHRVLGANGDMVGYGGGITKKKWLLKQEWKHFYKPRQMEMAML